MLDNINEIVERIAATKSNDLAISFQEELDAYILACGWTNEEFDAAYMEHINEKWSEPIH